MNVRSRASSARAEAILSAVTFSVTPPGMSAAAWGSLPRKVAPS